MGVDYYTCDHCGRNFPDCCYYFICSCDAKFCSNECGGRKVEKASESGKYWDDDTSCVLCRVELISDSDLLNFLLKRHNLTRSEAEALYRVDLPF